MYSLGPWNSDYDELDIPISVQQVRKVESLKNQAADLWYQ